MDKTIKPIHQSCENIYVELNITPNLTWNKPFCHVLILPLRCEIGVTTFAGNSKTL